MDEPAFCYRSRCSHLGCRTSPRFKIAATWVSGSLRELKTYGLACEDHRDELIRRARKHRAGLCLTDEEVVGPVQTYLLEPGRRDGKLACLRDDGWG